MKSFGIPLIGGISEHESLISSSHIELVLGLVNSSGNVGILSMDINNDLAVVAVKTNVFAGESNLLADLSGDALKVNLGLVDANFSKKNNLFWTKKLEYFADYRQKMKNLPFQSW